MNFIARTLTAGLLAGVLMSPSTLSAQCDPREQAWQRVEINLGSVTAPIVGNEGQLADDVAFAALGATGTGARFHHNGQVTLVLDLEEDTRVGFEPVNADGPASLAPTEPIWGTVVYGAQLEPTPLDSWAAVNAHGLWGDATVEHRVTGRTWRMRLSGEAADLNRLALRAGGIGIIETVDGLRSGDLHLTLEGDTDRQLTLHPAIVTLGDEVEYIPFTVDADQTLRLSAEVPEGAVVETVVVMAPYFHQADAVIDGRGGYLATGIAVDTLETGRPSGRDVAVVRLGEDGRSFAGLTILASSGDDEAAGIASRDGVAYVAGTAGASDFPLSVKSRGVTWPAAFAARIEPSGELAAGGYLQSHGLSTARDIAVDEAFGVLISGVATPRAKNLGDLPFTTVLPSDDEAPRVRYAVAALSEELLTVKRRQTFEGAASDLPLELRIDCDGTLHVGLPSLAAGSLMCPILFPDWRTRTYPQPGAGVPPAGTMWLDALADVRQPNFPFASWGFHALKWKQYSQTLVYDPIAAAQNPYPTVPVGHVAFLDAARLNVLEMDTDIFPDGDPAGEWQPNLATANIARRGLEAAIGAAAYAAFWKSPTYMNLSLDYPATDGAGVMELNFCTFRDPFGANGLGPIEICQNQLPSGLPIDTFDATCVDQDPLLSDPNQLFLDQVRLHQWYITDNNSIIAKELEMPGHEFMTRFEQANPGGVYIGDPPTESRFAVGQVAEAVDRQLAFVVEGVPVEITAYADGKATAPKAGTGLVRSVDLAAAK